MVGLVAALVMLGGCPPSHPNCAVPRIPSIPARERDAPPTEDIEVEPEPPAPLTVAPQDTTWDWLRTNTGEWLKGRLVEYEDQVRFDSDKFGVKLIDWSDIDQLHTAHEYVLVRGDGELISGRIHVVGRVITVEHADGSITTLPRVSVFRVVPKRKREIDVWYLVGKLGLNSSRGNTETGALNVDVRFGRVGQLVELSWLYTGHVASAGDDLTANAHRAETSLSVHLRRYIWLVPLSSMAQHDTFRNISAQVVAVSGVRWQPIDLPTLDWTLHGAAGYVFNRTVSSAANSDRNSSDLGVVMGARIDWDAMPWWTISADARTTLVLTSIGLTNHTVQLTNSFDVTDAFDLDFTFQWDRTERPRANETGERPLSNDLKFITSISLELGLKK